MVKVVCFPPKISNKTKMSSPGTSIQHCIGDSSQSNEARKRNKRHPDWKLRNKTISICDMSLHIENPKESTKNY